MSVEKLYRIVQFVRPMRGRSQARLCRLYSVPPLSGAEETHEYAVVKFANGPCGVKNLANECLGSHLARTIGLPSPESAVAFLGEWLSSNSDPREDFILIGDRLCAPQPGLCFASIMQDSKEFHLCDWLPIPFLSKVENLQDSAGAYLLNLWFANNVGCHAVYSKPGGSKRGYQATFIDFGDGWGFGRTHETPHFSGTEFRRDELAAIGEAAFEPWLQRISAVTECEIRAAIETIPPAWYDINEVGAVICTLLARARNIRRLLDQHRSDATYPIRPLRRESLPLGHCQLLT